MQDANEESISFHERNQVEEEEEEKQLGIVYYHVLIALLASFMIFLGVLVCALCYVINYHTKRVYYEKMSENEIMGD